MISFASLTEKRTALLLGRTLKKQSVTKHEHLPNLLQQHPARYYPRSKFTRCEEAMRKN
jgi:hypothetical protein